MDAREVLCLTFLILMTVVLVGYGQEKTVSTSPSVQCALKAPEVVWKLGKANPKISAEIRPIGTSLVMPAVYLTPLSKNRPSARQEYWAPFDLANGTSTASWQKLGAVPRISTDLKPLELLWAPTKSSVWPDQSPTELLPPGQYTLRIQIEIKDGKIFWSNPVKITVVK